jgi:hypothetical protein
LRRDGLGTAEAVAWSHCGLDGLTATAPTRGAWQGLFVDRAFVWSMTELVGSSKISEQLNLALLGA